MVVFRSGAKKSARCRAGEVSIWFFHALQTRGADAIMVGMSSTICRIVSSSSGVANTCWALGDCFLASRAFSLARLAMRSLRLMVAAIVPKLDETGGKRNPTNPRSWTSF